MPKKPTLKKKSESNSRKTKTEAISIYSNGDVVIFDTAAGRLIGKVVEQRHSQLLLEKPAILTFDRTPQEKLIAQLGPIEYAPGQYWVTWAGVRGHTLAIEQFLAAYDSFVTRENLREEPAKETSPVPAVAKEPSSVAPIEKKEPNPDGEPFEEDPPRPSAIEAMEKAKREKEAAEAASTPDAATIAAVSNEENPGERVESK